MNIRSIDDDGEFFRNNCEFPMYHHQRDQVLQSGVIYQIKSDKWLETQPSIEKLDNPLKPAAKAKVAKD